MNDRFAWWNNLRHGGLLLDAQRLAALISDDPEPLRWFDQDRLRRRLITFDDAPGEHRGPFIGFILEAICGFAQPKGEWYRGSQVKTKWSRRAITGESVRPRHLWIGKNGATLPVFIDDQPRIGIGRGRRIISHVLQWLRQGNEQLALITNGRQWRLVFAGLDYEAFCQWDIDSWFAEGEPSPELNGFRALFDPELWTPQKEDAPCPLLAAVNESRKGQADLSQILGERVRQAAELLVQAHTPALKEHIDSLDSQDIYRAAVRMIMRLVVILFAESREGLLARDNPIYHTAYSLQGLREQLERISQHRLVSSMGAYPRILALLRLIYQGSSHPDLPVPAYGGELFAPGSPDDTDGMKRALHLFETACFGADVMTDYNVRQILELLTRTKVKIRQGRANLLVPAPVDFSSLDSEYIGILYEGLLDFELRCAVDDQPIVFLAVGNQPALPLSTLEQMDDRAIKNLLEKLKDTSSASDEEEAGEEEPDETVQEETDETQEDIDEGTEEESADEDSMEEEVADDPRYTLKSRAETWARRACQIGNLVRRPRGRMTPEKQMQFDRALDRKARQLVVKVVLPGEWYLVRWGGTRKGSGTFYTRPQLAVPTVHRTLRPLAYDPPAGDDGQPDTDAPAESWTPKKPEEILGLKVCDPACGSGSFPLAALRFLTGALYDSLIVHNRIHEHGGRAVLDLIFDENQQVDGGRWSVAGKTKKDNNDGRDELRGTGGVAGGDESGDAGLRANEGISQGGTLRTDQSDSQGSSLRPVEHRRGTGTPGDEGIPQSSVDGPRLPVGGGNADQDRAAAELSDDRSPSTNTGQDPDSRPTPQRPHPRPGTQNLTDHQPLTTGHQSGHRPPATSHLLASEHLPCRPDDDDFEPRTKAILRRYIVERCIYGVDLDPLAVELCRLSLWIETLDRSLPLTFLNHKIRCGNSLVGAWFDQFLHYPVMAWSREGGDKNHTGGVHFQKEAWTKAIKEFSKKVKPDLIAFIDGGRFESIYSVDLSTVQTVHDAAETALAEIHSLGIAQVDERAARYEALLASDEFQKLQTAFDLWCALWFWPADQIDHVPLPSEFAERELSDEARAIVHDLAAKHRFFHWELEFPDVFNAHSHGFDAVLGNPPWDIAKPSSKEFFSAHDPLYRSYGKQEAVRRQTALFTGDESIERDWLDYSARFKAMSNWVKYVGFPFGDRITTDAKGKQKHDCNLGDRGRGSFATSQRRHQRWKRKREESAGYADAEHSFRHQGSADLNLYKLFLEQAHHLLRDEVVGEEKVAGDWCPVTGEEGNPTTDHRPPTTAGAARLGLIVPSGLYSDFGTGDLRRLFVDHCQWEWLFGFENREKIFDIDSRFKFNPVIVSKGGETQAIRTAFMRRSLADWENAEQFATLYPREQIVQFSPNSRAILEVGGPSSLSLTTAIYSGLAVMGELSHEDSTPRIRYLHHEFFATADSKHFPPVTKWEAEGFSCNAHGFWTNPDGDIAMPVTEGRMIDFYDFFSKSWVSGKGRTAVWERVSWEREDRQIRPQYLIARDTVRKKAEAFAGWKVTIMDVTSATNARTVIACPTQQTVTVDSCRNLIVDEGHFERTLALAAAVCSTTYDWLARFRVGGLHITWFQFEELPIPDLLNIPAPVIEGVFRQAGSHARYAAWWLRARQRPIWTNLRSRPWKSLWAVTRHERLRQRVLVDAIIAALYGLNAAQFSHILNECDYPSSQLAARGFSSQLNPKGFWRVDKRENPEHRLTILSLVAFHDLQAKVAECGGDVGRGIESFCRQNDGEGWMLPETLRLADYGLGHDDRAKEHQPVRACFGPRFYDWQLAQPCEESWRECHLHARNLLGEEGYQALLDELAGKPVAGGSSPATKHQSPTTKPGQKTLFETDDLPLFPD